MREEALEAALRLAPNSKSLVHLARNVNEELGLDWSEAKWRGIWKDNPSQKFLIQKKLGESFSQHQHGQKCHVEGSVKFAVVNDAHAPYHDKEAVRLAAKVLRWWQPDVLVYNGDNIDAAGLSRFDQNPARKYRLQDEVDLCQAEVFIPLNAAAGKRCRKIVLPGNHDLRALKYLWAHPDLFSVRSLQLPALLGVEELGMEYAGYAVVFDDKVEVSHGTRVSTHAGLAARAELVKRGYSICTMTGHNHRAGRHEMMTPYHGLVWGQEIPCLCQTDVEYGVDMNWVKGLGLGEVRNHVPWGQAVVFADDYSCRVGDKRFEVN